MTPSNDANEASGSAAVSPSRNGQGQHRAPEETVQMNILGRDASDAEQSVQKSPSRSQRSTPATAGSIDSSSRHSRGSRTDTAGNIAVQHQPVPPTRDITNAASGHAPSFSMRRSPSNGTSVPFLSTSPDTPQNFKKGSKWFSGISWGTSGDDPEGGLTTDYECLDGSSPQQPLGKRGGIKKVAPKNHPPNNSGKGEKLLDHGSHHLLAATTNNDGSTTSSHATVEDQLRQDCAFFYQISTTGQSMNIGSSSQAPPAQRFLTSTSSLAAMSRRRVMSSRDGALFMNRYEQLNQDMYLDSDDDDDGFDDEYVNHHDLQLDDNNVDFSTAYQQHNPGLTDNVVTDGLKTSSLFYEQNGRVLMRLPRDMVKLIMDHDLEPGILSVEQCRRREDVEAQEARQQADTENTHPVDPLTTRGGGQHPDTKAAPSSMGLTDLPELHYVMTVPDDLYQRVVSEISMEAFPPYWGFFKCCNHESDRADIKLALAILGVVLFLLMVGSIEWPTD
jgi:hypothetical protein